MEWKNYVASCCGEVDKRFAKHPSEINRAYTLLGMLRDNSITWYEFENELRNYLREASEQHIDEQVATAETLFRGWLE